MCSILCRLIFLFCMFCVFWRKNYSTVCATFTNRIFEESFSKKRLHFLFGCAKIQSSNQAWRKA